jgi:hypothetical protein
VLGVVPTVVVNELVLDEVTVDVRLVVAEVLEVADDVTVELLLVVAVVDRSGHRGSYHPIRKCRTIPFIASATNVQSFPESFSVST